MNDYDTPTQKCPYCDSEMEADYVDVGVGMVQCGPYHCYNCQASEIGPELHEWYYKDRNGCLLYLPSKRKYHGWMNNGKGRKARFSFKTVLKPGHPFTEREIETGFYEPDKQALSPYANTIQGELVNHIEAKQAYNIGLLDEKDLGKGE